MACTILLPSSELKLAFVSGKVVIDVKYLQEQVAPCFFSALHATLQIGSEELTIPLEHTSNHLGEEFYILDESLSSKYIVVLKDSNYVTPQPITICDSPPTIPNRPTPLIDLSSPFAERNAKRRSTLMVDPIWMEKSILPFLNTMRKQNTITKMLQRTKEVQKVKEVPKHYNGDIAFEFPPTMGIVHAMDSMEHKFDPHWWSKPQTSNIAFPGVCRRSQCLGILKCVNELCPRLVNYRVSTTSHFS